MLKFKGHTATRDESALQKKFPSAADYSPESTPRVRPQESSRTSTNTPRVQGQSSGSNDDVPSLSLQRQSMLTETQTMYNKLNEPSRLIVDNLEEQPSGVRTIEGRFNMVRALLKRQTTTGV